MTQLEEALVDLASLLDEFAIPYMLIGGLAVSMWGEARATLDVDLTVWVEPEEFEAAVLRIAGRLRCIAEPVAFARRSRVLPVQTANGTRADIVFAALPEERNMIARAHPRLIGGHTIKVASVEDLILMKLISERPKDIDDARRLLRRYRSTIDAAYLEPRLRELAEALARRDILDAWEQR